jgi:hypothetical protein
MQTDFDTQFADLEQSPLDDLRARYTKLFGENPPSGNRSWLVRRIAWRLQALTEGDLSERARRRALEIANDADLRLSPPRRQCAPKLPVIGNGRDPRLPPPGTILVRKYKGRAIEVKVLADSFHYQGNSFSTLSAVAKAVTGDHCNGFHFFRLRHCGEHT